MSAAPAPVAGSAISPAQAFSLARMGRIAALQYSAEAPVAAPLPAAAAAAASTQASAAATPTAAASARVTGPALDVGGARALEAATRALIGEAAAGAWLMARARGARRLARGDVSLAAAAAPARFGFAAGLLPAEDLLAVLPPAPPAAAAAEAGGSVAMSS